MLNQSKKRLRLRIIIPAYPAFNIYSFIAKRTTALGPVCIASAVNEMEGWDVEVIDENNLRRHGPRSNEGGADHEILQRLRPADVVGIYGGLTSTIPRLYKIARFYKERGITTIVGGQHFAGKNKEEALSSVIDYVVIGEGEETIKELLHMLEEKRDARTINGIAYCENGQLITTPERELITDFDKIPIPDFSLVRYAKIDVYPVERIRGCGMDCEFCTVKGNPRFASPERMLETISRIVETQEVERFFIVDDLFGQQRDETVRFCHMLCDYQKSIGKDLNITVQIRLDKANDTELIMAMREAGIDNVAIGFESPIEEELQVMKKKLRAQDMISLSRKFHEVGFLVHGMFIFGYPLKEEASFKMPVATRIDRYKKFIKKAKIDTIQVLLPVPLPGTELRERLDKKNRIYPVEEIGWEYYDGNFPLFEPSPPMTAEEMQYASGKIMGGFYQFRYLFMVGVNIFSFLKVIFFPHNIKLGWWRWYRHWRNNLIRFGGWITMKKWITAFKKASIFPPQQKRLQHSE
ncbi:B12-binding domain-containing radical SAM protein [Candidatus Omnitrophota bacterium]